MFEHMLNIITETHVHLMLQYIFSVNIQQNRSFITYSLWSKVDDPWCKSKVLHSSHQTVITVKCIKTVFYKEAKSQEILMFDCLQKDVKQSCDTTKLDFTHFLGVCASL